MALHQCEPWEWLEEIDSGTVNFLPTFCSQALLMTRFVLVLKIKINNIFCFY